MNDEAFLKQAGDKAGAFVASLSGATDKVLAKVSYNSIIYKIKGLMVFENHETFFDVWHRILFVSFQCLYYCLFSAYLMMR